MHEPRSKNAEAFLNFLQNILIPDQCIFTYNDISFAV